MIEHELPYSSLIGAWHIPNHVCDDLIDLYKTSDSKDKKPGKTFNPESKGKMSTDLTINLEKSNHPTIKNYFIYLQKSLENYLEKYPMVNTLEAFDLNEPPRIALDDVAAATMVDLFSNSILPLFQFITPCCNHFGKFSYASCNLPNISLAVDDLFASMAMLEFGLNNA